MPSQTMPKINLLKLPDPAARTAKFVNMMNATKRQEAEERQATIAQQRLDLETKEDVREEAQQKPTITKMEQDNLVQALSIFREGVTDIAEGDVAAAEALRADLVSRVPGYEKFILPASQWTPEYKFQLKTTAEQEIQKTIATPIASLEVTADGSPRSVQVGGPPGTAFQSPVYDAPETSAPAPQVAPRTPTTPPAAEAPNPFAAGYKPNSAAAPVNSLSLVVDSALETGVMAKADFDKLVRIAKPGSGPKLEAWTRQHNIIISPDAPGVTDNQMRGAPANLPSQMAVSPMAYDGKTPPADFAVYRGQPMPSQTAGLAGAPPMQNTMLQTQPRTSTKLQQRNPNISPAPGIYSVPTGQVAATSQAQRSSPKEEAAKKRATTQVEIEMAPELAKATKSAERTFQLKAEAPKERGVATRLIANIDDRINTIDRLLRNPERRSIVGRFEGNIPYLLQNETQADAQADFDRIKNTDTLTSLVEMKQDSPTGGSPVGNASNQDVLLVARGANSLIQTGSLSKFDSELMNIRRQLYNARVNAIKTYNDVYGDVIASDPRLRLTVPAISDRYLGSKGLGKKGTSTKVDYNNPLLKGMKR